MTSLVKLLTVHISARSREDLNKDTFRPMYEKDRRPQRRREAQDLRISIIYRWGPLLTLAVLLTLALMPGTATAGKKHSRPSFGRLVAPLQSFSKNLEAALFALDSDVTVRIQLKAAKALVRAANGSVTTLQVQRSTTIIKSQPQTQTGRTDYKKEPLNASAPRIEVGASGQVVAEAAGTKLAEFSREQKPAIGYWENRYFLVEGGQTLAVSDAPIQIRPKTAGTALTLPGYTDMNWNNTVNLNWFRGSIEVVRSPISGRLWAVSELYLEEYLRGIAEAQHSASMEHLKVMAIVSRSYAVHHLAKGGRHQGEPFHLKNSRNGNGDDQVYRGYLSESRQPRIAQAAADTAGVVVTYNGNPVITPYSSNPGGRTRSPKEAGWNVDWPWVVSVPDPDTAGMSRLGHGVGLSGEGSRRRAERGETAAQIITYYFPGASLGRAATANQTVRVSIFSPN